MVVKFTSVIRRGNKNGTGFFYLSKNNRKFLNLGDRIRVKVLRSAFFAKIIFYSHRLGVYVPKHIVAKNNLLNKKTRIQIDKVDGFYAKVYSDGRIYIPKDIVENQKLKHNEIILIKGIENGKIVCEKYSKIHVTKRKNRLAEYHCVFDKNFCARELLFKIEKCSREDLSENLSSVMRQLLKGIHYAFISRNSVIIFKGNKIPAIINANIYYPDIAFYSGAYFADGTRKGNSWAICASTFEQARYYLKMHEFLIKDTNPEFTLSYTNIHNIGSRKLKRNLTKIWKEKTGIEVDKFRIRKPTGKSFSKWNKYGTLVIREHRQILLDIYNFLLKGLIKEILMQKNKELALDFLCGVMEGDGCASGTKRGHVMIFGNGDEVDILGNISNVAQIKFKISKEDKNKYSFRIGALEILRNFHFLKDKIFILYPKRRIALFERLKTVGATKFLIGNHEPTSWVKTWLKNNGFCDENYKITDKGVKLRNELVATINKAIT